MHQERLKEQQTNSQMKQKHDKSSLFDNRYLNASFSDINERDLFVEAPRQLPKKSYSLAPDMVNGWKPKKPHKINFQNVFPLNFSCQIVDLIVKNLVKKNPKFQLVYLGARKTNSYDLHQNRQYQNPYPVDKKIQYHFQERPGINKNIKIFSSNLTFSSDFQAGNLDVAIKINENQYDLFMRVDSNTKGHTNWYFFQVQNLNWIGSVKFNVCNFRRDRSLYQRGMKPYVKSFNQGNQWAQKGYDIQYQKKSTRYKFLYNEEDQSIDKSQG